MDCIYSISMSKDNLSHNLSQQLEEYLLYPHKSELVRDRDLVCEENKDAKISSPHSSFEWNGGKSNHGEPQCKKKKNVTFQQEEIYQT